jgi:hypothetical protein
MGLLRSRARLGWLAPSLCLVGLAVAAFVAMRPARQFLIGEALPASRLPFTWTLPIKDANAPPVACALLSESSSGDGLPLVLDWPGMQVGEAPDWAATVSSLVFHVRDSAGRETALEPDVSAELASSLDRLAPSVGTRVATIESGSLAFAGVQIPWKQAPSSAPAAGPVEVRVEGEVRTNRRREPFVTESAWLRVSDKSTLLPLEELERTARVALRIVGIHALHAGKFLYEGRRGERVFSFEGWRNDEEKVSVDLAVDGAGRVASASVAALSPLRRSDMGPLASQAGAFSCR